MAQAYIDQAPTTWYAPPSAETFRRKEYGSDAEVFQAIMDDVYRQLDSSDTIARFHQADYKPKSVVEIEAVFRVYDQALRRALAKQKAKGFVSARQESKIQFAQSETSHGLRRMIIDHVMLMSNQGEPSYVLQDFTTILNGELQRFDKESGQNVQLIKNSGTAIGQETMKRKMDIETDQADDHSQKLAA